MKKKILALTLSTLLAAVLVAGCNRPAEKKEEGSSTGKVELKNFEDRVSYMIGADIGASLRANQAKIDPALVSSGLADSFLDRPLLLTEEEIEKIKLEFTEKMQQEHSAKLAAAAAANKAEGEAFLAENAKKPGVLTTASGLQYEVVTLGTGPKPGPEDMVKVHYRGTLVNGKEFDSSYQRGEPVLFKVGAVIPGWSEALQLMPVGSTYKLALPGDLAYGEREVGPDIGPNSTLLFEVELLGIEQD